MLESEILHISVFQDAKNGAEIKAVDAYCWLHSTVHLDTSLMRKLNTLPKIRDRELWPLCRTVEGRKHPICSNGYILGVNFGRKVVVN